MAEIEILGLKYFLNYASCPFAFSLFHRRLEANRRAFLPVVPSIGSFRKEQNNQGKRKMENLITVTFPGGKKVDAEVAGRVVSTDQPAHNGGEGTAPEPFTLFMASIATCAGLYALNFCEAREISTLGMSLAMRYDFNWERKLCEKLYLDLKLPEGFPEKYKKAILRSMDLCTVKRHMLQPPEFIMAAN